MQNPAQQYATDFATNPFNIDVPTENGPAFTQTPTSSQIHLPSRDKSTVPNRYTPGGIMASTQGFSVSESNEMDTSPDGGLDQPSPATTNSQSRGGSTSHTSYSPGGPQQQYRASPKTLSNQAPLSHATTTTANPDPNFFTTADDMFSGNMFSHPGAPGPPGNGDPISNGFIMTQDWDMSAMGTNAELPPMSEGSWNQMLESINLGWDSIGPPHSTESHTFGH
jgi:hypothetical protein